MKKFLTLAAFAAAISFGSCSVKVSPIDSEAEGGAASMGLTIMFPKNPATRADDPNAEAKDLQVNDINVFIFKNNGLPADGNNSVVRADFSHDPANNTYTLQSDKAIRSTAGTKRIYVGVNLPAGLIPTATTTEDAFLAAASTSGLSGAAVAMMGYGSMSLAPQVDPTVVNQLNVTVTRLVAKVTATMGTTPNPLASSTDTGWNVTIENFTVGGTAQQFYPRQRTNGQSGSDLRIITPGAGNGPKDQMVNPIDMTANAPLSVNPSGVKVAAGGLNSFYVPEHSTSALYQRNEATYAVIRGELAFDNYTSVAGTTVSTTPAAGVTGVDEIHVIRHAGQTYFFADAAQRDLFIALKGLAADNFDTFERANGKFYTFYHVFLNSAKADRLSVYRNQFINIQIDGVNGVGEPGQPTKPLEPTLVPDNGTQPATQVEALLNVQVDVEPWDYYTVGTILE